MNISRNDYALLFELIPVNDIQLAALHSGAFDMNELCKLAFQILVSGENIFHNDIEKLLDTMASRWCAPSNLRLVIMAIEDLVAFYDPMLPDQLRYGTHQVEEVKVYEKENTVGVWVLDATN